jgi:hypothetical protein
MKDSHNYSVDTLKKAAFVDELNNVLINISDNDPQKMWVVQYMKDRIKEIDTRYKDR